MAVLVRVEQGVGKSNMLICTFAALLCTNASCGTECCAFCLHTYGIATHVHVALCRSNPFKLANGSQEQFESMQRQRRRRQVLAHLSSVKGHMSSDAHWNEFIVALLRECQETFDNNGIVVSVADFSSNGITQMHM